MSELRAFLAIIIIGIFGAIWGYYQLDLFPIEEYGLLFAFTSLFGGMGIGYLGAKLYIFIEERYFDN